MKNIFTNIKGDAFGGISVDHMTEMQKPAFGVSSGLGPSAGLYGAIFLGLHL